MTSHSQMLLGYKWIEKEENRSCNCEHDKTPIVLGYEGNKEKVCSQCGNVELEFWQIQWCAYCGRILLHSEFDPLTEIKSLTFNDTFEELDSFKIENFGRLKFLLNSLADIERRMNELEEKMKEK